MNEMHHLHENNTENNTIKDRLAAAEAELAILRLVVNTLPDLIYAKDRDSRHIFVNKAKLDLYGVDNPDEILGKTDLDLHPEFGAVYLASEQAMIQSRESIINREEPIEYRSGEHGWILTTKMLFFDETGEVQGFVGIGRDITDLKRAEERQQQQQLVIAAQQQRLRQLSTPVIPIYERILMMPLIGEIDEERSRDMMRALLAGISRHRALVVIMDLTGVPLIDTGVAQALNRSIQAARLKGTTMILCGIADAVAETLVDLGIDLATLEITADLMEALKKAFALRGITLQEQVD